MIPAHALDLRPDGIDLLTKRGARWLRVASADLSDDPDAAMSALRAAGGGEGPIPVRAILPREQLLYAVLENLPSEPMERFRAMRRALDGRTPYAVDELAFDWNDLPDGSAAVCAVAKETLAEAEAFLAAHGFAPVAFVAAPRPAADSGDAAEAAYPVEPFLAAGSAALPDGMTVARGGAPIRCAGDLPAPAADAPAEAPEPHPGVSASTGVAAAPDASPEPAPMPPLPIPPEAASEQAPKPTADLSTDEPPAVASGYDAPDAAPAGTVGAPLPAGEATVLPPAVLPEVLPADPVAAPPAPVPLPVPSFASRRTPTALERAVAAERMDAHHRIEPRISFRPVPPASPAPVVPTAPGASAGTRPAPVTTAIPPAASAPAAPRPVPDAAPDEMAPPFARPRNRLDPRAADRIEAMRGTGRADSAARRQSPDDVIAAFAGLKGGADASRRGIPIPFLGGLAAGIVLVGALGGWVLFGSDETGETADPRIGAIEVAASDPAARTLPDAGTDPSQAAAAPEAPSVGGPLGAVRADDVAGIEPLPVAAPVAGPHPVLPNPEAAAVRSAPRALAAPSAGSESTPATPERLPREETVELLPATAPAIALSGRTERPAAGPSAGEPPRDTATADAGPAPDPSPETSPEGESVAADAAGAAADMREFSGAGVQQSASRRQADPMPAAAGIVEVAAVPATWGGPREAGTLARPLRSPDEAPGILLPPAPAGPEGVAVARPAPTPDGAEGLDGVTLFAGDPPRTPPARPEAPPTVLGSFPDPTLAGFRPRLRSPDAAERWLASEAAAVAAAETLAREAADPALASAEPAAAELAAEPAIAGTPAATDAPAVEVTRAAASALPNAGAPTPRPSATADASAAAEEGDAVLLASADVAVEDRIAPGARPDAAGSADDPDAVAGTGTATPAGTDAAVEPAVARTAGPDDPRPLGRPRTVMVTTVAADAITEALAAAEEFEVSTATAQAIPVSRRPGNRTTDLTRKAAAILEQRSRESVAQVQTAAAAAIPATAPSLPTRASVARAATLENALPLRKTALVGTYGNRSSRRALIRTEGGRYVKVEVGDRVDGGKVQAIGNGVLVYVKGGRKVTLEVPGS